MSLANEKTKKKNDPKSRCIRDFSFIADFKRLTDTFVNDMLLIFNQ